MSFHITDPETDALARKVAALKQVDVSQAVHQALEAELARQPEQSPLVERVIEMTRKLRASGDPTRGLPADKAFIDSLYERD